jgi:hypothetical protein
MAKIIKYAGAYLMWIVDLGLSFWLFLMSRTVFLGLFAVSYKGGNLVYAQRVDFADKVFSILLGLGWLAFMIIVEAYFRAGASRDDLLKRFASITGPVVLAIFGVDLILFWLQRVGGGGWLRQFVLAAELGIGILLLMFVRFQSKPNSI